MKTVQLTKVQEYCNKIIIEDGEVTLVIEQEFIDGLIEELEKLKNG